MKNPMTPAGIEPAFFRFVAQHLNYCATAVPRNNTGFTFFEPCIVIYEYLCNKNQQNVHFLNQCFNLIVVSSTCFEHPSVHRQEDLYM